MINKSITRYGSAIAVAAGLVLTSAIATATAAPSGAVATVDHSGYTKDQCKDGGWQDFRNSDGSQMFKNQGQCVAYFNHQQHKVNHSFGFLWAFIAAILSWWNHILSSIFSFWL